MKFKTIAVLGILFLSQAFFFDPKVRAEDIQSQLDGLVTQLQTNPDEMELRKKIILLTRTMPTKPVIAEGTRQMFEAALKEAKTANGPDDLNKAIADLKKVSLMVPWMGKLYWDIGIAQMHLHDFGEAKANLDLSFFTLTSVEKKEELWEKLKKLEITEGINPSSPDFIDEENAQSAVTSPEGSGKAKLVDLVAQLQKGPDSPELRKQIIQLVLKMKEKPKTPETVKTIMANAKAIVQNAQSPADFKQAADVLHQATLLAPWSGVLYYNAGVLREKANELPNAINDFNLYLLAEPNAKDSQKVMDRISADQMKLNNLQNISGVWVGPYGNITIARNEAGQYVITEPPTTNAFGQTSVHTIQAAAFTGNSLTYQDTVTDVSSNRYFVATYTLTLSSDGKQLYGSLKRKWDNGEDAGGDNVTFNRQ
jgi:hypothetical protein